MARYAGTTLNIRCLQKMWRRAMQCDKCRHSAVIFQRYSGLHLCREHFITDFESKAKRDIRAQGGLPRNSPVAIASSGGYKSCTLLYFLAKLVGKRRGITLFAVIIDEGIPGRDTSAVRNLATSLGVRCISPSTAGGKRIVAGSGTRGLADADCLESPRESILVQTAIPEGATRIACGTSLDDEALFVLTVMLKGEACRLLNRCNPDGRILQLRPFVHIPAREIALYATITLGKNVQKGAPSLRDPFSEHVKKIFDEHRVRHPSAPHSLVSLGERLSGIAGPSALTSPSGDRRKRR